MAQHAVSRVHKAPGEVSEQGHMIDQKYPPNELKISIIEITIQFFLNLKTLCAQQGK